jgi:hypothetical protein
LKKIVNKNKVFINFLHGLIFSSSSSYSSTENFRMDNSERKAHMMQMRLVERRKYKEEAAFVLTSKARYKIDK